MREEGSSSPDQGGVLQILVGAHLQPSDILPSSPLSGVLIHRIKMLNDLNLKLWKTWKVTFFLSDIYNSRLTPLKHNSFAIEQIVGLLVLDVLVMLFLCHPYLLLFLLQVIRPPSGSQCLSCWRTSAKQGPPRWWSSVVLRVGWSLNIQDFSQRPSTPSFSFSSGWLGSCLAT